MGRGKSGEYPGVSRRMASAAEVVVYLNTPLEVVNDKAAAGQLRGAGLIPTSSPFDSYPTDRCIQFYEHIKAIVNSLFEVINKVKPQPGIGEKSSYYILANLLIASVFAQAGQQPAISILRDNEKRTVDSWWIASFQKTYAAQIDRTSSQLQQLFDEYGLTLLRAARVDVGTMLWLSKTINERTRQSG